MGDLGNTPSKVRSNNSEEVRDAQSATTSSERPVPSVSPEGRERLRAASGTPPLWIPFGHCSAPPLPCPKATPRFTHPLLT